MATFHWCSIVSQLQIVQLAPSSGFVIWLNDIRISTNFFKIKNSQIELLVVAFKTLPAKVAQLHLNVGGCSISHTFLEVCELGVNLDSALLFPSHVKSIFKSALYHLKNFSRQWPSFSDWNPHSYLHHLPPRQATVYCLPNKALGQYIQNLAASLLPTLRPDSVQVLLLTCKYIHVLALTCHPEL